MKEEKIVGINFRGNIYTFVLSESAPPRTMLELVNECMWISHAFNVHYSKRTKSFLTGKN